MSAPYPDHAARQYPTGRKPDRRQITKCSEPDAWYEGMVGQIITVHYFASFGAWDMQGRWLWYYDLSGPVNETKPNKKDNWLKKIFK